MSRRRRGPSPLLVILAGALFVFGGYFVWTGFLGFIDEQGDITHKVTQQARASATARSNTAVGPPTIFIPATDTPVPPCQMFRVNVEHAKYRECPLQDDRQCPFLEIVPYGTEFCVYSRAPENPEWYVIDLNPGGAFRDLVYIHESVVEAAHPTPTPTITSTSLPTISPTPSPLVPPTHLRPTRTPTPPPVPAPTDTPPNVTL